MKIYKKRFKEQDKFVELIDPELVDKLFEWFEKHPYPQDHSGLHKFAKSLQLEADILETYIYAIISCFVSGGNFNKKGKSENKFDPKEIEFSKIVEAEHVDKDNKNPVVQRICEYFEKRIGYDHISDNKFYYSQGKEGKLKLEELK